MMVQDSIRTAFIGLKTNKTRSFLTILGIVIGIAAVILMMSIGQGAESLILNQIGGLGAETIVVRPGKEPTGPSDIGQTLFANSLKTRDVEALVKKGNVPNLVQITPVLMVPGSVSFEGETFRPTILGSSGEFFAEVFNIYPAQGVLFDENDIRQNASVVVIGSRVAEELFASSDAVGEYIKIRDKKFRVVGVFPPKGQVSFFNINELALVPYTTAQVYLLGIDYFHEVIIKADSAESVGRAVRDIEITLRESHNITDPKDDDFFVATQQALVDQIRIILGALTAFLSSVVAIALVVGGIGVMNIMFVSVTERTREIGLRKALGATEKDILLQFLFEAVTLTAIGGVVGIILGATLSFLAALVLGKILGLAWIFTFPIPAALLGLGVSALVGFVFGLYPAMQASKKSPIEALRYE